MLDLHNVESLLHERCAATEGGIEGLAHRVFEQAAHGMERPMAAAVRRTAGRFGGRCRRPAAGGSGFDGSGLSECHTGDTAAGPRADEEAVVFSGNMEYHPNRSAVRFFRREVWPLLRERWPRLVWRLVGKNPEAVREFTSGDPRIEVRGAVADAVAELARGRLAVVPLLAGSGTRLKILEAWAAGLPVVSTTLGAEGLPVCDGENILLADGAAALAEAISRLLACYEIREKLGTAGRLLLEKEFTWEVAWKSLDL